MKRTGQGSGKGKGKGRYYARYISHYTRKNYALIGLGTIFLAGVLLGAVILRNAEGDVLNILNRLVSGFVDNRTGNALAGNFIFAAMPSLVFVAILFFCGFGAISQPLELAVPLFRGLGFGLTVSSLYGSHGVSAAGFVLLYLLPNMMISSIAILFCARESLRLSRSFFSVVSGRTEKEAYPVRLYIARYMIAIIMCAVSAFFEAIAFSVFANYVFLG